MDDPNLRSPSPPPPPPTAGVTVYATSSAGAVTTDDDESVRLTKSSKCVQSSSDTMSDCQSDGLRVQSHDHYCTPKQRRANDHLLEKVKLLINNHANNEVCEIMTRSLIL